MERPIQTLFSGNSAAVLCLFVLLWENARISLSRAPIQALFKAAREYENCLLQRQVSVLFQSYFPSDRLAEKVDNGLWEKCHTKKRLLQGRLRDEF